MRVAVWLAGWQHLRVNVYLAAKDKKKKKKDQAHQARQHRPLRRNPYTSCVSQNTTVVTRHFI